MIFAKSLRDVRRVWGDINTGFCKKEVNITVTHHHYIIKVISWLVGWLVTPIFSIHDFMDP